MQSDADGAAKLCVSDNLGVANRLDGALEGEEEKVRNDTSIKYSSDCDYGLRGSSSLAILSLL